MNKTEFIQQIEWALDNLPMSEQMREFLTNLKEEVPTTEKERFQAYTEWMELIIVTMQVVAELSKYR